MAKLKLKSKDIRAIGYPEGPVISIAMNVMEKNFKFEKEEKVMELLRAILASPIEYHNDAVLGLIAQQLAPKITADAVDIPLNKTGVEYRTFGAKQIEDAAIHQMDLASRLPVVVAGALMPDAHAGYGLPIGGVLALDNAVMPYGVGLDIGCRMALSVFDIKPQELIQKEALFARELKEATLFGAGRQFDQPAEHEVMERRLFRELPLLKRLQRRAAYQLGSSGSGNHFVEFGIVTIDEKDPTLGLEPGSYVGLLSHSGSRSLGATIAEHYTAVARHKRRPPGEANSLAWLTLDEEEGAEYWQAMNLAGEYAAACHEVIHDKIAEALGREPIMLGGQPQAVDKEAHARRSYPASGAQRGPVKRVENHHNFAWKEFYEGREVVVHRKGATPAGKDVLGIIPGSMTAEGFIVKGRGEASSISSAAHGAGRKMSRSAAMRSVSKGKFYETLERHGVKLIGGGVDEAPQAYKDIREVMGAQRNLVDVVGTFTPKIVRMDR